MVKAGKVKHAEESTGWAKHKFQFKVCNNIHQIPCLESTELIEEWHEEEKVIIKKTPKATEAKKEEGKEGAAKEEPASEQDFEMKQRKKSASYPLHFETQAHSLPPNTRTGFRKLEVELNDLDRTFLDLKEARNDLEAYCYEMRNNLGEYGNYEKHAEASVKSALIAQINDAVEWLYGAGEQAPLAEYQAKFSAFKKIGDPIKKRFVYYSTIEESFKVYAKLQIRINDRLAQAELSDEHRKAVIDKAAIVQDLVERVRKELDTKSKTEDPSWTLESIQNRIDILDSETKAIFALPPPKKEEPVKEEEDKNVEDASREEMPKMEDAEMEAQADDVEMKEASAPSEEVKPE